MSTADALAAALQRVASYYQAHAPALPPVLMVSDAPALADRGTLPPADYFQQYYKVRLPGVQ